MMRISELQESSAGASSSSGLSRSKTSGIFLDRSEVSLLMILFLGIVNRVVSAGISSRATVLLVLDHILESDLLIPRPALRSRRSTILMASENVAFCKDL